MSKIMRPHQLRGLLAIGIGLLVAALVGISAAYWDTALLAGWDAGFITYLALVFRMMSRADSQRTYQQAQAAEPEAFLTLLVVIVTSTVALFSAVALATRTTDRGEFAQVLHFATGTLAVFLAWLLVHTEFALFYARTYYDEASPNLKVSANPRGTVVPFRKGLEFPDAQVVDYWDFMYYSFTIAMCYQTSDVTITMPEMRRATLLQAIVSFVFVLVILGFTVNAIGAVI